MTELRSTVALGNCDGPVRAGGVNVRIVHYKPGVRFARHAHESGSVAVVVRGEFEEDSSAGRFRANVGDCVIKPAGAFHANSFGPGATTTIQLELPGRHDHDTIALRTCTYGPRRERAVTALLFGAFERLCGDCGEPIDDLICDVLAALDAPAKLPRVRPAWLSEVEACIMRTPTIRVSDIAACAGVNPVHLARVFRRFHGCGLVEFMHRTRLSTAAAALADQRRPICRIAVDLGFVDQAHLTRVFQRQFGVTPARYRRMVHPKSRA